VVRVFTFMVLTSSCVEGVGIGLGRPSYLLTRPALVFVLIVMPHLLSRIPWSTS
jgi:hypothetical protein